MTALFIAALFIGRGAPQKILVIAASLALPPFTLADMPFFVGKKKWRGYLQPLSSEAWAVLEKSKPKIKPPDP